MGIFYIEIKRWTAYIFIFLFSEIGDRLLYMLCLQYTYACFMCVYIYFFYKILNTKSNLIYNMLQPMKENVSWLLICFLSRSWLLSNVLLYFHPYAIIVIVCCRHYMLWFFLLLSLSLFGPYSSSAGIHMLSRWLEKVQMIEMIEVCSLGDDNKQYIMLVCAICLWISYSWHLW